MKSFQQFLNEASEDKSTSLKSLANLLRVFMPFVKKELKMKSVPDIHIVHDSKGTFDIKNVPAITFVDNEKFSKDVKTFGRTSSKNRIVVQVQDRHPIDVLRTLAHELTHYHQHTTGKYGTGETGSDTENQANVEAGIIMRNFDHAHPEFFKLKPFK